MYVFENRLVFREVVKLMTANLDVKKDGGFFYDFLRGVYGRDQAIAPHATRVVSIARRSQKLTFSWPAL